MKGCRKPDCDCIEKAERANGGPVKSYQCLYATVEQGLLKERPRENALPYYCTRRDVLVLVKPTTIEPELRLPYNAGNTLWAILRGQYRKSMDLWLTHLASLPIEATCSGEGFEEGKWYDQAQIYFSMEQRGGEYSPSFVTASLRPVKKEESEDVSDIYSRWVQNSNGRGGLGNFFKYLQAHYTLTKKKER